MGFRNPFRIQVDENDVAYVTDYSPDAQHAAAQPRAGRLGPRRDRAQAVQLRLSALLLAEARLLPVELPRVRAAGHRRPAAYDVRQPPQPTAARRTARAATRWVRDGGPALRARPARRAAGHRSGHLVLLPRQRQRRRSARRAWRTTRRPRADRAGSTTECPRLFPELYTGGVAPHGAAQVPLRRGQPEHDEVPAVLRQLVHPRRVQRGHAARGQLDSQEPRSSRSTASSTAARRYIATSPFPFECDNPMDMQFGTDGSFYLLTYGDGFFAVQPGRRHVPLGVRQGPARAAGRAERRHDRRHRAADGPVLQRRLARPRPGRLDPLRVGLHGDGTVDSTDPNPTHVYTTNRRLHAPS